MSMAALLPRGEGCAGFDTALPWPGPARADCHRA